jgi:hypothetical protein
MMQKNGRAATREIPATPLICRRPSLFAIQSSRMVLKKLALAGARDASDVID